MPDTKELLAKVRKIEIRTRRLVDELTGGAYHSVFKGRGIEFAEVREYLAGDDVRTIDWNVTARAGHPYVKQFTEERELTVLLLVDVSASGDFGSGRQARRELAAELAALLAFSAIRNNDRVGLLMFSDRIELHLPPRQGRSQALRIVRELLAWERTSPRTDLGLALETFLRTTNRRAVAFLLSDFLAEGYQRALPIAGRRHDLVALRLSDPAELAWPQLAGGLTLDDAEDGSSTFFGGRVDHRYHFERAQRERRARQDRAFRQAKVDCIDLLAGQDYVAPLMAFFRQRERRR